MLDYMYFLWRDGKPPQAAGQTEIAYFRALAATGDRS